MSQQIINLGLIPNDGSGDALRVGAQKINENFTELYDRGIPEQAGNNGKFLTTSGTVLRWDRVTDITGNAATVTNGIYTTGSYNNPSWIASLSPSKVLPTQSGNNGKYLTTDGSTLAWVDLEAVSIFDYNNLINRPVFPDNTSDLVNDSGFITSSALTGYATETYVNSRGFITSNGLPSQASNAGKYLTTNGTTLSWATVTSGTTDYNNLTNKPTIPTSFNSLVNGVHTLSLGSTGNTTFPTGLTLGAPRGVGTVNFTAAVDKEFQIETGTATSGKLWQFGTDGSLTIPGDIKSQGNINIDINLADSTLRRWQFGEDGSLMTPNDLQIYKGAGSVNYIESTIIGGLDIVSKGLAQFKTTWDPQGVVPTGYTQPLSRRTTTSADLFGYNIGVVAPDFANWNWRFTPDGNLEIPGDIKSNGNINIEINTGDSTLRRWQFGEDGDTVFPNNVSINYSGGNIQYPRIIADSEKAFSVQGQGTSGSAALSWTVDPDAAGQYAAVAVSKGGGDNLAKVILQAQSDSGDAGTAKIWKFDETGALTIPGDIRSEGNINIEINLADSTLRRWQFGEDGALTLPMGGNISEGGGIIADIRLTPAGGANANQALLIYPTAAVGDGDHIHLTAGGGTTELYLGDDIHYVKLGKGAGYNGTIVIVATGWPNHVTGIDVSYGNWAVESLSNLATTGGTGTGLTVTVTQVAGVANAIAIVSGPMGGYTANDTITVTSGAATATFVISVLAPQWIFAPDGDLYLPPGNIIRDLGNGNDIRSIPGPYADDAAAQAAGVAVGNPYHKTGTSGQVFVRLT